MFVHITYSIKYAWTKLRQGQKYAWQKYVQYKARMDKSTSRTKVRIEEVRIGALLSTYAWTKVRQGQKHIS